MNKYIILQSDSAEGLVNQVNMAIERGYTPQGGVSASVSRNGGFAVNYFCQALVLTLMVH